MARRACVVEDRYHACQGALARFWAKVDQRDDAACWEWQAAKVADGYGVFSAHHGAPMAKAHRYAYVLLIGPVTDDLVLDHLCRNRACVNPAHLELVTVAENVRRGIRICWEHENAPQTCGRGHDISEYVWRDGRHGAPEFACRACIRENTQLWRARHREQRRAA